MPLLDQVQAVPGIEIDTSLGDMAYSHGDVREAVEDKGVALVAKVPPVTNGGRFPKTDFVIDNENKTVTCPAGSTTGDARKVKDHKRRPATEYRFPPEMCAACPLRDQCTTSNRGRRIVVGRHHDRIEKARRAHSEPDTKALLRKRPKVEQKNRSPPGPGNEQARYRGRRKTRLQALLAATVANFKRLVVLDAFGHAPAIRA